MAANDGISEANQWSSQYFGEIAQQWNQEFDVAESLRAEQQMLARMEEQERMANAVLPPGRGGLPPGADKGEEPPVDKYPLEKVPPVYWIWVTAGGACERCQANEDYGPIIAYDTFPDGSTSPPAHKNCRCHLEYINPSEWDPSYKPNVGQDKEIDVWYGPQLPGDRGTK